MLKRLLLMAIGFFRLRFHLILQLLVITSLQKITLKTEP